MNKKIRKLLRSPRQFFVDAGFNLLRRIHEKPHVATPGKLNCRYRYSFILVVSNDHTAAADRILGKLVSQSVNATEAVEVICVDTRPEDSAAWNPISGDLARFKLIRGPGWTKGAARNAGLGRVTGDWTCFIDVDEDISTEHIQKVDHFLKSKQATGVALACCKLGHRDPANGKITDNHPRNAEFVSKSKVAPVGKLPAFYSTTLAGLFFRTSVLTTHVARFAETGTATAQELAFATKFLYHMSSLQIGLIVNCRVLINGTKQRLEATDLFAQTTSGILATKDQLAQLFTLGCDNASQPPKRYALRAVLHYLAFCADQAVSNGVSATEANGEVNTAIDALYAELFQQIPVSAVESFGQTSFRNRVGLLKRYKNTDPKSQTVYVENYDEQNAWVKLRFFSGDAEPLELFKWGSTDVTPAVVKARRIEFADQPFVFERVVWMPCNLGRGRLNVKINKAPAKLYLGGKLNAEVLPWMVAEHYGRPRPLVESALPMQARTLRRTAARPENAAKYRDAWLFIDRDVEADDNAEHLYRYVLKHHPEVNAFFILRETSPSWARLAAEGFRLLPFDSPAHKIALLHCRHLLSSHAAPFVVNLLPKAHYGDLLNFKFTFLQHGVTKDDISKWINARSVDCFVTTSDAEYDSISENGTRYKVTPREVVKTGFPRHDALLAGAGTPEKLVMIMPTWRLFLAGALQGGSSTRSINEAFFESQYAKAWKGILHSERFARVMKEHDYKAVFFPHPNIEPYLDWFEVPEFIQVIRSEQRGSIQALFQRSAMMLTDYSSVAFEMAYLHKPVLYYQFDRELVFGGQHSYQKGYYDYDLHGFGPIAMDEDRYLDDIETFIARNCEPGVEYRNRMNSAFAHIDTDNCRRTFEAVSRMDIPRNQRGVMPGLALRYAELASQHRDWRVAADRWARQALVCEASLRPRAMLMQLQAWRYAGELQKALELLESLDTGIEAAMPQEFAVERAELAMIQKQWPQALELWDQVSSSLSVDDDKRAYFQDRFQHAKVQLLLLRARELRQLGQAEEGAQLLADVQLPDELRFKVEVEQAELATALEKWDVALAAWQKLLDAKQGSKADLTRFKRRVDTVRPLAAQMQLTTGTVLAVAGPNGSLSDTDVLAPETETDVVPSSERLLLEQLDHWAKTLACPELDQEVRLLSLREIAHLRIQAGDLENAEKDINQFRSQGAPTSSHLLLSLELAVARGHAGEAMSTLNMLFGMPLNGLGATERKRLAQYLQTLAMA